MKGRRGRRGLSLRRASASRPEAFRLFRAASGRRHTPNNGYSGGMLRVVHLALLLGTTRKSGIAKTEEDLSHHVGCSAYSLRIHFPRKDYADERNTVSLAL